MTFYELLRSIASYDAALDYLAIEYPSDPGTRVGYQQVIAELLGLEPKVHRGGGALDNSDNEGGTIVVFRGEPDAVNEEPYWHVSLEDRSGERWSMSFIPWAEYLGLDVAARGVDLSPEQMLAHILWEITFYGWTSEDVEEKGGELREIVDDLKEQLADEDDE